MDDATLSERRRGGLTSFAVLDALPRAIIVTDPDGRILVWNRLAESLYGWPAAEVVGRPVGEVLVPIEHRGHADEIMETVRAGEIWSGDFTVLRRDGEPVRVWVTDRPVFADDGQVIAVVGASEDVTEQRLLERRAQDLTEHLRLALDAGGLGTFRWDMATGATEWDERLEALFGLAPGSFDGTFDGWVALLHPEDQDGVLQSVEEAVAAKGRFTVEHRVIWPDGSLHWLQGAGTVTLDHAGNVTGTIGCTRDVTQEVLAEQERQRFTREALTAAEQERINRERLEFLSRINDALSAARDRHQLMRNVAEAAVPRLGDWCSIYVLPEPDAEIPEVEIAHVDPEMVAYALELQQRFPYDPHAPVGMPNVIRTGQPEFYPVIDDAVLDDLDTSDEQREVVRKLVLRSSISVPLVKRDRVLGGLQLIMTDSGRQYTEDDVTLVEAVAARIASSLENLRLAEAQRSIATTLQASLLPAELPEITGVDVAVRYWANGEGIEVGGDFYDLFSLADDRWAVVIGDVCGTGPAAAAVTGLARHTIASAAWHSDDHTTVLENLNRAMRERRTNSFCTAVYGTLQPTAEGMECVVAIAGHPLPIVARADGTIERLGVPGSLVGLFDEIGVTPTSTLLHPGDTLVLYTDGITDVRPPYDLNPEQLDDLVAQASAATTTAEELADRLHADLSAVLPITDRKDDIALLILRLPTR
jgi:PAS domain S-box-containing protein